MRHGSRKLLWIIVFLSLSSIVTPALELSRHTLSRCVLRYGDPALFRPLHRKLRDKECIHVAIIGGSVAAGHKLPNSTFQAFPALFEVALNEAFPCLGRHTFTLFIQGGMATDFWIDFFVGSQEVLLEGVDLIVVDTAVNDMRALLQRTGRFMNDMDAFIRTQTEILMTLLLQRSRRDAAHPLQPLPGPSCSARTNYSRTWTGAAPVWLGTSTHNTHIWRGQLPRSTDAVYAHLPAAIAHGVPYISIIDGLGPFRTRAGDTFLKKVWWSGDFHPGVWGHEALTQLLMYFLAEQLLFLDDLPWSEDPDQPPVPYCPRPPSYIQRKDLDMYLDASPLHIATVQPVTAERMRGCEDWSVMEDVPHKPGLLSVVAGSACTLVAFADEVRRKPVRVGELHLTLLKSYEHMGRVRVTVATIPTVRARLQDAGGGDEDNGDGGGGEAAGEESSSSSSVPDQGDCLLESDDMEVLGSGEIDCLWEEHISEAHVEVVKVKLPAKVAGDRCMAFRLEVMDTTGRAENKVKVMALTLF